MCLHGRHLLIVCVVAVVGFEHSRYTFYEARGLQEICVQVFNPPRNEELIFDIPLLYWTVMDSAGIYYAL